MPLEQQSCGRPTDHIVTLVLVIAAIILLRAALIWLLPTPPDRPPPTLPPPTLPPPSSAPAVGGATPPPKALIVDIANMYVGWYMEKYGRYTPHPGQDALFDNYIECMADHYARFIAANPAASSTITYVVKNHKTGSVKMTAPPISAATWARLHSFVAAHPRASIAVAEDYLTYPAARWKKPSNHYLRAADDYLCFHLAQAYRKNYVEAWVMSDDNYNDFAMFGSAPKFKATVISPGEEGATPTLATEASDTISPRPNTLGALHDYNVAKISLDFSLDDPRHSTAPPPGKVWGRPTR